MFRTAVVSGQCRRAGGAWARAGLGYAFRAGSQGVDAIRYDCPEAAPQTVTSTSASPAARAL
ncbi:MAG: hypothetical protein OXI63_06920 [Candidatus Poribacteria bacterium]|nr:hypothetical protein [Candidatus Poribacteria bacterium]